MDSISRGLISLWIPWKGPLIIQCKVVTREATVTDEAFSIALRIEMKTNDATFLYRGSVRRESPCACRANEGLVRGTGAGVIGARETFGTISGRPFEALAADLGLLDLVKHLRICF